jgi:N-acetylneuraminic acid mutarotase
MNSGNEYIQIWEKVRKTDMRPGRMVGKARQNFTWILAIMMISGLLGAASISQGEEDTWMQKANMLTARMACGASSVDGKIYVIGGYLNNLTGLSTVEAYDPETDTWAKKADMPTPRLTLATSVVNGKIYAIGGSSNGNISTVEEYDPVKDTWEKKANMPTARNWFATSVVNDKIYAIGGGGGSGMSIVEEYDPATDTWTRKADMPTRRWGLSTGVANGRIYAIGGAINLQPETLLSAVEEYDPVTDTWTQKADMPEPRAWIANHSPTVNGKIYVVGGWPEHLGTGLAMLEEYNPVTDTWAEKADMLMGSGALGSVEVNGKIYAIGGWNGGVLSTVEEYDPGFAPSRSVEATGRLPTTWGQMKRGQ